MAISVMVGQILKSPPIAAHCSPLLYGNFSQGVIPEKSSHCNPLQPTLTWQFQSGVIHEKSSHCSPLQPTLTWQFQPGGNSKVLPLQPNLYIILPPLNKLPPHSYINLPLIDKLPPPPTHTSKWEDFREDIRPGCLCFLACKKSKCSSKFFCSSIEKKTDLYSFRSVRDPFCLLQASKKPQHSLLQLVSEFLRGTDCGDIKNRCHFAEKLSTPLQVSS